MNNILPIFIINLPQSEDRQFYISELLDKKGLKYNFIEAINGKELTKDYVAEVCDQEKAKELFGRELLLGEIGCALSHKKIYQKMIREEIPMVIVLEDDATIEKNFATVVSKILTLSIAWDILLLGHYKDNTNGIKSPMSIWYKHRVTAKYTLHRLANFGFGTHGYIITLEGAKKLEKALTTIYKPVDHYTADNNMTNVYAICPTIVNVNSSFETLIDSDQTRTVQADRALIKLLKKTNLINIAVNIKNLLKIIKPIRRYK